MSIQFRNITVSGVVALALIGIAPSGSAGLISTFTGWTEMNECPPCDSTVNFAVWKTEGDTWRDDNLFQGLNLTRLDAASDPDFSARYLYLYQVINSNFDNQIWGPFPEESLADFQILNRRDKQLFTSGGYVDAVFRDNDGAVHGDANNNYTIQSPEPATPLVDDPAPDIAPDPPRNQNPPSDHRPSASGMTDVDLLSDAGYVAPIALDLFALEDLNLGMGGNDWQWVVDFDWASGLFEPDKYSPVLFLTSMYGPAYDMGSTRSWDIDDNFPDTLLPDRFPGAAGDLPTAVSEPSGLALLGLGLAAFTLYGYRKNRC